MVKDRRTFFLSRLLQNFRLSRQICHLQHNSGQISLFRLKSHHFRTYFLYMIRCNNISRSPQPAAQNLGVATPNPTPELTPLLHSTSLSYSYLDLQPVYQLSFNSYCTSGFTIICLLSTPQQFLWHTTAPYYPPQSLLPHAVNRMLEVYKIVIQCSIFGELSDYKYLLHCSSSLPESRLFFTHLFFHVSL